jgi:hypothetical protein
MTTAAPSAAFVTIQPASTDAERLTLAGFLGGYRGLTRDHPPRTSAVRGWTTSATPLRRKPSPSATSNAPSWLRTRRMPTGHLSQESSNVTGR